MYRIKNNTGSTLYINGFPVGKGGTSPLYKKNQILTCQNEAGTIAVKLGEKSFTADNKGKLFVENKSSEDTVISICERNWQKIPAI